MKERRRRLLNGTTIPLYLVGTAMFALSAPLLAAQPSAPVGALEWLGRTAQALGPSIVITTLVASILDRSFNSKIESRFSIVKGAEGADVHRLYADREAALADMTLEAQRANCTIDILCVSGTDLFQRNTRFLEEVERRFRNKSRLDMRVIILDPRSRYAIERSLREEHEPLPPTNPGAFDYPRRQLCQDTVSALRQLQTVVDATSSQPGQPFHLTVRLCNCAPTVFYAAFDDVVFAEQYHLGIPSSQSGSLLTHCLGKVVPILQTTGRSELGYVLSDHFEYLWQRSKPRELVRGSCDRLEVSLAGEPWLDRLIDVEAQDNAWLTV